MSDPGVLYVTYDGLMEPMGASMVVPYVGRLARQGFRIEILSFEKADDLRRTDAVAELQRSLCASGVRWTRRRYHRNPSIPATLWDVAEGARLALARARGNPGLIIHARSYLPGVMGVVARNRAGARLILDTRGLWVQERVEARTWGERSLVVRVLRRVEQMLFRESDFLVHQTCKGQSAVERLVGPGVPLPPFRVIPTCADLTRFRPPIDAASLRQELGMGDGPVIVHSGTLTGWYLGELTMRVAGAFIQQTGGRFVILTKDADAATALLRREHIAATVRTANHHEMPRWLGACDAGLALVRPTFAKTTASPVKVGEYLGVGLAVGGIRGVGDLAEQFDGSNVAFAVDPSDRPEHLAHLLAKAVLRPDRQVRARALAQRHYNLDTGVAEYGAIYRQLGEREKS